jgi:hypothetical protein
MTIHQYISIHEFTEWVEQFFKIDRNYVFDTMLEEDYIEGSLGSRHSYGDSFEGINQEIQDWFDKFFEEHNIKEIQLKYGGG